MTAEIMRAPQATLAEQVSYAQSVAKAGILPQAYKGRPADIIVAMGLGQSMGLSPMESVYRINVIQGKPTASAELIASQVRKAGHRLRIRKDEKKMSVTCTIYRADDPEFPFEVTRDKAWADRMGLSGKDNYKKQPLTMLTWRAITACAREACPEALYGVAYTPDEMDDMPSAPMPVEHQVVETKPAPSQPADRPGDLAPIRARFKDFMRWTQLGSDAATGSILAKARKPSMDKLTEADVAEVCAWMDEKIAEAEALASQQETPAPQPEPAPMPAAAPDAPAAEAYQPELLDEEVSW